MTQAPHIVLRQRLCLAPGIINLNAGTTSPTSDTVERALSAWHESLAADPIGCVFREGPRLLEQARRQLAAHLRCPSEELLLFTNATYGINTVLASFPWRAGDEILTTDQEYHHYHPLWRRLEQRHGMHFRRLNLPLADLCPKLTPTDIVSIFADAIGAKTRALFFSHVTSATGLVLPAAALCRLARKHGLTAIVDGAHAPGHIDLDLAAIDADFYAGNIHKWLMGATGSGFLHVRRELRADIAPLIASGPSAYAAGSEDERPTPDSPTHWAMAHEYQGTRDYGPLVVIPKVLAFHAERTASGVRARCDLLRQKLRSKIEEIGLVPLSLEHPDLASCMLAFLAPPTVTNAGATWTAMRARERIELAFPVLDDGRVVVRVSLAWFVEEFEIDYFIKILQRQGLHP